MPYTDQVHYKSNHPKPIAYNKQPTVVSAAQLDEIRTRADPTLSRHTENSERQTVAALNAQHEGEKALSRAHNWKNTDFSNEDLRIERVLDHKKKIEDRMFDMAEIYQERLQEKHEEEVAKAQAKIEDDSEYSRYLKVARHAADCANFETEYKAKELELAAEKTQQELEYKEFLERAADKEKQFKSKLLEKAAADARECAEYNERVHRDLIYDKKMGTAEKNEELQEAKYFHEQWLKDQDREHKEELDKMHETRDMYEDYLRREKEKKEAVKLEAKLEHEEEIATEEVKDELDALTVERERAYEQRTRDRVEHAEESAEYVVAEAEKKKNDTVQSMMLAKIDGERKREEQIEWREHWQRVNQDTLEMQELEEAERHAMSVAEKMEDIAYGRRMIELVEVERDQEGEFVRKELEAKEQRGIQAKKEMDEAIARKKQEIAEEKARDRQDLNKAIKALNEEKQIPIRAAQLETRPEYKQSYEQVIRFMNKTEKSVSWQGDEM